MTSISELLEDNAWNALGSQGPSWRSMGRDCVQITTEVLEVTENFALASHRDLELRVLIGVHIC